MDQVLRARRGAVALGGGRAAAYAAAGTAAALAGAGTADAAITYSGVLNILVQDTATGGTQAVVDLQFGATPHHLGLLHSLGASNAATGYAITTGTFTGTPAVDVAGFTVGTFNYVDNIPLGAQIDTLTSFLGPAVAGTMAYNAGFTYSEFLTAGVGFIGVRFNTNQYGWVRVNMNGGPENSFTIVDFAYGDVGDTIQAGQIPAPGSLAALALGAAGVTQWRRRKVIAA